jgi:ABC-2 type transport system permease protein
MVKLRKHRFFMAVLFVAGLVLLNLAAQYTYTRFDFTKEKRFTLSQQSKEMLKQVSEPMVITVFLDGQLPAAFKRLKNATKDLLSDYKAYTSADIKINFVDPVSGLSVAEQDTAIYNLSAIGIEPINLQIRNDEGFAQKLVFPMAMVETAHRRYPIKLLQNLDAAGNYEDNINNSIQNLEYVFTSAIKKLSSGQTTRIGFTEGNGELSDVQLHDAINTLSASYQVGRVDLDEIDQAGLDKLEVLFVCKPQKPFTEAQKYKLNYFVMKGGRTVWSVDQAGAELDSLKGAGGQLAFNRKLNLDDMLFVYGARINYTLLADANCTEIPVSMGGGMQSQIQMAPWIYYPILMADTVHNLVKNLDGIRSEFVSTVDTIGVRGLKKTVLLRSSAYNKVLRTPLMLSLQMVAEQPDPKEFANAPVSTGVLLEGSFPSVFLNRGLPKGIPAAYPLPASSKPTRMIVLGDGDLFKNQVSSRDGSVFPLGFDRYTQRTYGNKTLLLNIADYLSGDDNLIALRNKEIKVRLLDKTRLRTEKTKWQLINTALPLLLLILFAIFQHYYRRRKYAR